MLVGLEDQQIVGIFFLRSLGQKRKQQQYRKREDDFHAFNMANTVGKGIEKSCLQYFTLADASDWMTS